MKYIIKAYNILELGQRTNQEDSIFPALGEVRDSDRLFILCDGMGGHESGEVASSTVCGAMSRYILQNCPDPEGEFSDETFGRALAFALDELDKKDTGAKKKMGTTMTFLKLHDKGCTIAHIGDSRVYHIRPGQTPQETRILHQTGDHSLVNDLVKLGEITAEEAKYSKQKNVITRAMQPCMERRPKADIYHTHDIKAGDYFFMCSDGILEDWDDDNVKYTFCNKGGRSDNEKIEMLVKATSMHKDNHSAIIIHVMKVIDPLPVQKPQPVPYMAEIEDDRPVLQKLPIWKKLLAGFAIGIAIGGLMAYVVPKILPKDDEKSPTESQTATATSSEEATITFMAKGEEANFKIIGTFKDTVGATIDTAKNKWKTAATATATPSGEATITFMAKGEEANFKIIGTFKDTVGAKINTAKNKWKNGSIPEFDKYVFFSKNDFADSIVFDSIKVARTNDTVYCREKGGKGNGSGKAETREKQQVNGGAAQDNSDKDDDANAENNRTPAEKPATGGSENTTPTNTGDSGSGSTQEADDANNATNTLSLNRIPKKKDATK